jgi:hypothetical protein
MASQVLSGSSGFSYTNNTGQNVRIVINYMRRILPSSEMTMTWAGVSVVSTLNAIGRNLAFSNTFTGASTTPISVTGNNADYRQGGPGTSPNGGSLPTEIMLAPGQTFSAANINAYNIVVIPEAG